MPAPQCGLQALHHVAAALQGFVRLVTKRPSGQGLDAGRPGGIGRDRQRAAGREAAVQGVVQQRGEEFTGGQALGRCVRGARALNGEMARLR